MTDKYKESHNCNIVQQEKHQWFLVIKKHEVRLQEHVNPYLSGKKRISAIDCYDDRNAPQEYNADAGLFSSFANDSHDHAPMQSDVYTHERKTPIRAEHVQNSCQ